MRFIDRWRFKPVRALTPQETEQNQRRVLAYYLHGANDFARTLCEELKSEPAILTVLEELQKFVHRNQIELDPVQADRARQQLFMDTVGAKNQLARAELADKMRQHIDPRGLSADEEHA